MLTTNWRTGALFLVAACSGAPSIDVGTRYDVTEHGVVATTSDPSAPQALATESPDWLSVDDHTYVPKRDTPPDLSSYHFGRSGLVYPSAPTPVDVELGGLAWNQGDSLQLVSPNVGLSIHQLETPFAYPPQGAHSITGQRFDWARAGSPLIDSGQGDTTFVAQMSSMSSASGTPYSVLTRAGIADKFTTVEGGAATLHATLAEIAATKTFAFRWSGTAYAALASQAGPGARPGAAPALAIRTIPQALVPNNRFFTRMYMYLPSLVDFGPVRGGEDYDEVVSYGNPFATKTVPWSEFVTMVYAMPVRIDHVGTVHALAIQATPVDELRDGTLAPVLAPVRDVRIDGAPATSALHGVGTSPTITWDPPALGTATNYEVTVQAIVRDPNGTGLIIRRAGTFVTSSTSLVLPAFATRGLDSYALTITAISSRGRDLAAKPFLGALPYASVDYVTSQIFN